jgi:AcrR family transcriptional regulator
MQSIVESALRPPRGADDGGETAGPRGRLLEAALRIFAEKGVHAASVREITEAAGANIAAVNYYFGSKSALVAATLERYVRPIVRARTGGLDDLERQCSRTPARGAADAATREVVERLVDPMVRLSHDPWGGRSVILLLLQLRALPHPDLQDVVADLFDEVAQRFVAAFRRADPNLDREAAFWRYNFALGSIMQALTDANPATRRLERLSGGLCKGDDAAIAFQLVQFICAGMSAPTIRRPTKRRRA